jgi:ketosteroid isomerase-like protein
MKRKDFSGASARLAEAARLTELRDKQDRRAAHIQSVREQIDAIGRGDLSAALQNAHEDVELNIFAPIEFRWIRHARGIDALRVAIAHNFDSVDDQTLEIRTVVAQGDTVVLLGRERGVIRETAQPYDVQFVQKFTFVEGRLASVRIVAAKTETPEP